MWFDDDRDSPIGDQEPGVGTGSVHLYRERTGRTLQVGSTARINSDGSFVIHLGSVDPMANYYLKFDHSECMHIFTKNAAIVTPISRLQNPPSIASLSMECTLLTLASFQKEEL
jgi:hypothetical protein